MFFILIQLQERTHPPPEIASLHPRIIKTSLIKMARESTEVARGPTPGNAKKPLQKSGGVNKATTGNAGKRAPPKKEEKPKAPEGPSITVNKNFKPAAVMQGVSWADKVGGKNKKPEMPKQQAAPTPVKQPAQPKPAAVEATPAPAPVAESTPAPVAAPKADKKKKNNKSKKQPEPKKAPKSAFELADNATVKKGDYHAISAKLSTAAPSTNESAEAFQKFSSQSVDVVLPEGASTGRAAFSFSGVATPVQKPVQPDAFTTGSWAESIEGSPISEHQTATPQRAVQQNVIQPPSATTTAPVKTSPAASLLQRGQMPSATVAQPTTTSMPAATLQSTTPSTTAMPSMPLGSSYDRSNWGTPGGMSLFCISREYLFGYSGGLNQKNKSKKKKKNSGQRSFKATSSSAAAAATTAAAAATTTAAAAAAAATSSGPIGDCLIVG